MIWIFVLYFFLCEKFVLFYFHTTGTIAKSLDNIVKKMILKKNNVNKSEYFIVLMLEDGVTSLHCSVECFFFWNIVDIIEDDWELRQQIFIMLPHFLLCWV